MVKEEGKAEHRNYATSKMFIKNATGERAMNSRSGNMFRRRCSGGEAAKWI
jgi:hypothetical protein